MRLGKIVLAGSFLAFFLYGCDEILEIDIRKNKVILSSPTDSTISKTVTQTFRWEALKGARQYNLQIVSPSFDKASETYLDSITSQLKLTVTLDPGKVYHWRVRGVNGGYVTDSSQVRMIKIDSSNSLADQKVLLLFPRNTAIFDTTLITFECQALLLADRYIFRVTSLTAPTYSFDTTINAPVTKFTRKFPSEDRVYQWQVVAIKSTAPLGSKQSEIFGFSIDKTAPGAPSLLEPQDSPGTILTLPIALSWKRKATDINKDKVYLYKVDQVGNKATIVSGYPKDSDKETFSLNGLADGMYEWAVSSADKAGNESVQSERRGFTCQK